MSQNRLESKFQSSLIQKLKSIFPGAVVLKNDPTLQQGIPDLIVLYNERWAALEVKASWNSEQQPNQAYWIDTLDDMSYGAFIFPENEEEILDELQQALRPSREARLLKR